MANGFPPLPLYFWKIRSHPWDPTLAFHLFNIRIYHCLSCEKCLYACNYYQTKTCKKFLLFKNILVLFRVNESDFRFSSVVVYIHKSSPEFRNCGSASFTFNHGSSSVAGLGNTGLPRWHSSKESAYSVGDIRDASLITGLERSPGGGRGNPL